jgi:hypothetical protein
MAQRIKFWGLSKSEASQYNYRKRLQCFLAFRVQTNAGRFAMSRPASFLVASLNCDAFSYLKNWVLEFMLLRYGVTWDIRCPRFACSLKYCGPFNPTNHKCPKHGLTPRPTLVTTPALLHRSWSCAWWDHAFERLARDLPHAIL